MGNSTKSVQSVFDAIASEGIPDPRLGASGYGDTLAYELSNQSMADIVCERFNWKWNRATARPFVTNSWQQDYPQLAQPGGPIGWGEDCDIIDINNSVMPKPMDNMKWRRQLSRTNTSGWWPKNLCWMYNRELSLGAWPGAGVVYSPLITSAPQPQNPLMSMLDANGNILVVTGFGTTGTTAPAAPKGSIEGVTVHDGSVVWTVVSPDSQGFRIDRLPSATGPAFQIIPYYQLEPPVITDFEQLINPIPDSFSRFYYRLLRSECLTASANPADKARGETAKMDAMKAMEDSKEQGDKEVNIYQLVPVTSPVESRWDGWGPYTAQQPY